MTLRSLENQLHIIVLVVSIVCSVGGIWGCAFWWHPADGGRGGAIAVALSLVSLFINRPYGKQIFNFLTQDRKQFLEQVNTLRSHPSNISDNRSEAEILLEAHIIMNNVDVSGQDKQNRFMAVSAGLGTLAWGFGDLVSAWLQRTF
jgi:hypothetical protein